MNENPGETPNPLNPNPENNIDTGPSVKPNVIPGPIPPRPDVSPVRPASQALDANPSSGMGLENKMETTQNNLAATIESLDPTNRPMEQKLEPEKPKKKTGLIVGIIILILALIGGGVAAALIILNQPKTDMVAQAMSKIMSGNGPENVAVDGTIDIKINDKNSPITNLEIDLDSKAVANSMINRSEATITATLGTTGEFKTKFEEVYAANGDLYFKIEGATGAVEDMTKAQTRVLTSGEETNCIEDESGETNCEIEVIDCEGEGDGCGQAEVYTDANTTAYLNMIMDVIETVDGEWLRISTDELNLISNSAVADSNLSCLANMMSDINSSSNSIMESYSRAPFVISTTENIPIQSKENPVYRVTIDSENLAKFVDGIQNSILAKNLYSCLGWHGNVAINADNLSAVVNNLPTLYVEIDDNYNFTRLYLESDLQGNEMTIDLSFSYPDNVNVSEPSEYRDFSKVIQEIFSGLYTLPETEIDEETVVIE